MSASLVGSEMCIRDSSCWARNRYSALSGAPWECLRSLAVEASQGPDLVPVSYTHLTLPTICSV
eukprot:5978310-Alexandrium_andersonii.AAC.1